MRINAGKGSSPRDPRGGSGTPAFAAIAAGSLIEKQVDEPKPAETFHIAWRSEEAGQARAWWLRAVRKPGMFDAMLRRCR